MTDLNPTLISTEIAPLTEDERKAAIIKQIEYYFSEANLSRDRFLNRELLKYPGNLIPLAVLITFKKLQALSTDIAYISSVIESTPTTTLILSADKQSVGIAQPFARVIGGKTFVDRDDMTLYFKNLLAEHKDNGQNLSEENKKIILDLIKYHPKAAEKLGSSEISAVRVGQSKEHADTFCFELVRADGSTEDFSYLKSIAGAYPIDEKKVDKKRKERSESDDTPKNSYTTGCILQLTVPAADLDITKMKDIFNKYGTVKFVDVGKKPSEEGEDDATPAPESGTVFIRYIDAESAKAALDDASCPYAPLRLLEGDEEKTYFEAHVFKAAGGRGKKGGRGGRGGRGRGGRGGFKKSRND